MLIHLIYIAPALAIDCAQPKDVGYECDKVKSQKFYYDNRLKICQPLYYQGCGGNENLFANREECQKACASKTLTLSSRSNSSLPANNEIVTACDINTGAVLSEKAQTCDKGCEKGYECKENFCCPTKDHICSLPAESGSEGTAFKHFGRYTFSKDLNNCIRFSYFGSGGNFNNFKTFNDCKKFCAS